MLSFLIHLQPPLESLMLYLHSCLVPCGPISTQAVVLAALSLIQDHRCFLLVHHLHYSETLLSRISVYIKLNDHHYLARSKWRQIGPDLDAGQSQAPGKRHSTVGISCAPHMKLKTAVARDSQCISHSQKPANQCETLNGI